MEVPLVTPKKEARRKGNAEAPILAIVVGGGGEGKVVR